VYDALGVTPSRDVVGNIESTLPGSEILDQIGQVLDSTDWEHRRFDERALGDLVQVVLHQPHSDVLASVQLPLTNVRARTSHEAQREWKYGTSFQRRQIRLALLDQSRVLADSDREMGHRYALAAILLAAQESAINGTLDLGGLLDKKVDVLAGLTSRELTRIRRAILRAARQEFRRVEYALSLLSAHRMGVQKLDPQEAAVLRQHVIDGIASILRISRGRPDMQWIVANLCWMARSVLDKDDARILFDQLDGPGSGTRVTHFDRWLADARAEVPPARIPRAVEPLSDDVGRAVQKRIESGATSREAQPH
jgi:hypothetical protein